MRVEEKLGYVNRNQVANLAAGGAQAIAVVLAQSKGPGVATAISKGGVLLSEIISGRGSPGVIAGTTVEIAVDLAVHPAIRPFAAVLASQTSALIQLGEAYAYGQSAGSELDKARNLRREQVQKANAIVYLAKKAPQSFDALSAQEFGMVIYAARDPFSRFRQRMLQQ